MSLSTPSKTDRYAVLSIPIGVGPATVCFWEKQSTVIGLMTQYANCKFYGPRGFSVWHRRTATSQWKLITDTSSS